MADITYNVSVNLETKGNLTASIGGLNRSIGGLQSAATGVGHVLGGIVEGFRGAFEGVVESIGSVVASIAKVGAVSAFGAITYGAFKLNRELEDTNMWFAGVFKANGLTKNMEEGMEAGSRLMNKMRQDAAALPGEFGDLKNIMQGSLMAGLNAGLSPAKLEKISAQAMAMTAGQIPSQVVGRELGLMLGGRVTASNTLARMLVGGDRIKELRNMSNEDRVKTITEALQKWNPAIDTMKTSFTAMWTTTIDGAKRFLEVMTKPLFNIGKSFLKEFSFLDENGQLSGRAQYWAQTLGQNLADAVNKGRSMFEHWWPAIKHFATEAYFALRDVWRKLEPVVEGFGAKLKNLMDTGRLVPMIEKVLELYAASKAVGGVQSLMPSGGSLLSLAGIMGRGGSMGAIGGLGGAAGIGAIGIVSAIVSLGSMFHVLTDDASQWHLKSRELLAGITTDMASSGSSLGQFKEALEPLINTLGFVNLAFIKLQTGIGNFLLKHAAEFATTVEQGAEKEIKKIGTMAGFDMNGGVGRAHKEIRDKFIKKLTEDPKNDPLNKTVTGAGGGGGGVHVDKVEINISSNADPSRIARMTVAHLAELKKRTKISPYATNFSAVTK